MDVDAIISSDGQRLSEDEISRLIREKKCFYCKGDNHRSDKCWKKHGKPTPGGKTGRTTARNTEMPDMTPEGIADFLNNNMDSFSDETKFKLIDNLMPKDFSPAQN